MPLALRIAHRFVHAARGWIEEAGAIRPGTHLAATFGTFGERSLVAFPVDTLFGAASIHIGERTLIGRHCTLGAGYGPQDDHVPTRALVIGDRCVIGAGTTITAHQEVSIGDDVWFGQRVFVSDASHGYQDPTTPIGQQLGTHQPVTVGAGSWVGHGAVLLPGTTIGRQVVVAAGSVVRGTVPDHSVVAGVPAHVVRRFEPELGWVSTSDPTDVRPAWSAADILAMMSDPAVD